VLGLSAVRRAREGELVVAPPRAVEAAGGDERHHLERLRARAPERHGVGLAGDAREPVVVVDDGRVHPVPRLDHAAARGHDVQGERAHGPKGNGGAARKGRTPVRAGAVAPGGPGARQKTLISPRV
jgi:hypothetical protein